MGRTGGGYFDGTKFAHQNVLQIGNVLISADDGFFLPRIYSFRVLFFEIGRIKISDNLKFQRHLWIIGELCAPRNWRFFTILGQTMDSRNQRLCRHGIHVRLSGLATMSRY